jgi:UDP-N-acetylmuramoylalanine--D-glutamate ligase
MEAVIARPPLPPGPFLVLGLARSGVAAARALAGRGQRVVASDKNVVGEDVRAALLDAGVAVRDGEDSADALEGVATVVKSPGVPREAPLVAAALAHGIRVIGELELGWRLLENEFIALTGSNGKTTTVELIGHIHRAAGIPVTVAGNVGTALTSLPGSIDRDAVVVCEASSFQLEDTEAFAPEAAVLLNLAEDHLDRHGTFDRYRAAKLAIFAHQPPRTLAVVPAGLALDDAAGEADRITFGESAALAGRRLEEGRGESAAFVGRRLEEGRGERAALAGRRLEEGRGKSAVPDLAHHDGTLYWRHGPLMAAADIRLRGAHNRENAMAAAAVCLARGIDPEAVREGLSTFKGVPHRLEEIATIGGVTYVNDSKATNVASAEVAIRSFDKGVHLIAGGSDKGSDYAPLVAPIKARCKAVYLIGETAPQLHRALEPTGLPIDDAGDLERAFAHAHRNAERGDVVLLSPGCASYDQYRSYEHRGDHFRGLVATLR